MGPAVTVEVAVAGAGRSEPEQPTAKAASKRSLTFRLAVGRIVIISAHFPRIVGPGRLYNAPSSRKGRNTPNDDVDSPQCQDRAGEWA